MLMRELEAVTARDLARGAPAPRPVPLGRGDAAIQREENGTA